MGRSSFSLVLDGEPGLWVPPRGVHAVPQRRQGEAARIAAEFNDAFARSARPVLLIGSVATVGVNDAPQLAREASLVLERRWRKENDGPPG